jgi:hypothetical protein
MNTGIQDVANLAWKIALVESGRAYPELLESYDEERKPLSDALVGVTSVALRAATASNWFLERVRDGVLTRIASLDIVQNRAREAISELGISYRKSSIVRDCGGGSPLQAGDRAPDCEAVDETDTKFRIFDLIKEPVHTLLAVMPPPECNLNRLAEILRRYDDVMQGSVLLDGDGEFRAKYAHSGGVLYVIRPDGYIGFRAVATDLDALESWAGELFIEPGSR